MYIDPSGHCVVFLPDDLLNDPLAGMSAHEKTEFYINEAQKTNNLGIKLLYGIMVVLNAPAKLIETLRAAFKFQFNASTNNADPELANAYSLVMTGYTTGKLFESLAKGIHDIKIVEGMSKAGFKSQELLDSHFEKHASEFGDITKEQYLKGAQDLVGSKPGGNVLTKTRPNGDTIFYNKATNEFAVKTSDGTIRTYFKPTDGINYFNRQ